jgi:pimeloyl-ACP methyl ester carboxylesterase
LLLAAFLAACGQKAARPAFDPGPCPFHLPDGFAEEDVLCGTVDVQADRDDRRSGALTLAVAVFHATGDDARPDPIVYLAGGPGGAPLGLDTGWLELPEGRRLLEDRDIVFFDQRGTGQSRPALSCLEVQVEEARQRGLDPAERDLATIGKKLAGCRARHERRGVDPGDFTTAANAADVTDVMLALGYEEWNLLGVSYGTRLALTVLRDRPEHVRSAILDSVYPPSANLYVDLPASFQRALAEVFAACAADTACGAAYPDPQAALERVALRLQAEPQVVDVSFANDLVVDDGVLLDLIFSRLYDGAFSRELPALIARLDAADPQAVEDLLFFGGPQAALDYGMYFAVQCADEYRWTTSEAIAAGQAGVWPWLAAGRDEAEWFLAACDGWGQRSSPEIENEPVTSDVPVLLLSGQFDPITPPAYAEVAAETLSRAEVLVIPGQGHGLLANTCAVVIATAFLEALHIGPGDSSCLEGQPLAPFRVDP